MKIAIRLPFFILFIFFFHVMSFAWDGMPTPPLHVEGNQLKDPTGNNVLLHGWMQPIDSWFNGEGQQYSNPSDWTNPDNVAGMLNFLKEEATVMSDTSPRYGQGHGWYASFVRVNCDFYGGWTAQNGLVDTVQFNGWINNFVVPYANHLSSRGLYLLLCATGPINTPDNGSHNAGIEEQARLRTLWSTIANAPGIKNADNIMFELMNEPVQIESSPGNGQWGSGRDIYFQAFRNWIQPIIDDIRNTGANNVIWVPCLGWQGEPHGWVEYPFTGTNIGVAAHFYPAYGGVHNNASAVQNLWNSNYKPAADRWPMVITEMMWFPNEPGGYDDLFDGTTAGFGNAIKKAMDDQGNVSFLIGFIGDHLVNLRNTRPQNCSLGSHEGTQSYFKWLPTYTWAAPDDGTPEFEYAFVPDENPEQIIIHLKHAIKTADPLYGFSVKVDLQPVEIDSIVFGDSTNILAIYLSERIGSENEIEISYTDGNVTSVFDKALINFGDTIVFNLLEGAPPVLTKLQTNTNGDTLIASFSKKMLPLTDLTQLTLQTNYDEGITIPIIESSVNEFDSTQLIFSLGQEVYADYDLFLSWSGNSIVSSDSSTLETFSEVQVINNAKGLPVQIIAGRLASDGNSVILEFSKNLDIAVGQSDQFTLEASGEIVAIEDFYILENTIRFSPAKTLHQEDILSLSYTPGKITAVDQGPLEAFTDFEIVNLVPESTWHVVPGKFEAEDYTLQSGTDTESTADTGGGLNVGWIDNGDWMDYALDITSDDLYFKITFRVASPNNNCELEYYIDGKRLTTADIPNTGSWQVWQSVEKNIKIKEGKHYLKLVAVSGGFNVNYIEIKKFNTGIEEADQATIGIYPNPISDRIIIRSPDFQYDRIEVVDMMGKTVLREFPAYESEYHLPVNLADGMYFIKLQNEKEQSVIKIVIKNE